MLQDDITEDEKALLFNGEVPKPLRGNLEMFKREIEAIGQSDQLKEEMEKFNEGKDFEIAALKLRVKELEDKFQSVISMVPGVLIFIQIFKEFTFTSLDNIKQNYELFDEQFKKIKDKKEKEEQDKIFQDLEGAQIDWGENFLDNFGGAKASGTEAAKDEIGSDLSKYLEEMSNRFGMV